MITTEKTIQILVFTKEEVLRMKVQGKNPVERAERLMKEIKIEQFKIVE